jgi:hypothetical protein
MNTRALQADKAFIPKPSRKRSRKAQASAEQVAFDKADDAASLEKLRTQIAHVDTELSVEFDENDKRAQKKKSALEAQKANLVEQLKASEEAIKAKEIAETQGT